MKCPYDENGSDQEYNDLVQRISIHPSCKNQRNSGDATNSTTSSDSVSSPENLEEYFKEASETYGVDINLLKAIARQESNFNPSATSSAGAMGVMQLMPSTAKGLGVTNAYDAQQNIMGGAKLMAQNLKKYNGDVSLALAAYNAGGGNVDKYGGAPRSSSRAMSISRNRRSMRSAAKIKRGSPIPRARRRKF